MVKMIPWYPGDSLEDYQARAIEALRLKIERERERLDVGSDR